MPTPYTALTAHSGPVILDLDQVTAIDVGTLPVNSAAPAAPATLRMADGQQHKLQASEAARIVSALAALGRV